MGDEQDGEEERREKGPQVVEGQDLRHELLEVDRFAEDPQHERDLQADERPHHQHDRVEHDTEELRTRWVIGADGAGSTVRRLLGLSFDGITWPERFVATNVYYDFERYGYA